MAAISLDPRKNRLLAALPDAEWLRWFPQLEPIAMSFGQVLCELERIPTYVYFPTSAIVSLVPMLDKGTSTEIAIVGNDGIVGMSFFMGGESASTRSVVQSAGIGFRLSAKVMEVEFTSSAPVIQLMLRYNQALLAQMAQTAVCNCHHSRDQQLCRWLLLSLDRLLFNGLENTQKLSFNMLEAHRKGMIESATKLQTAGLIRLEQDHIAVLDREGIQKWCCECYAIIRGEYARLLPEEELVAGDLCQV